MERQLFVHEARNRCTKAVLNHCSLNYSSARFSCYSCCITWPPRRCVHKLTTDRGLQKIDRVTISTKLAEMRYPKTGNGGGNVGGCRPAHDSEGHGKASLDGRDRVYLGAISRVEDSVTRKVILSVKSLNQGEAFIRQGSMTPVTHK